MNKELFINKLKEINISINDEDEIINKLDLYFKYLVEYNNHTNITAITDEEDVYLKHFYDSIIISKYINFNEVNSIIDIGTGAGFPGFVLKIFFPHLNLTLLDSNNKKTKFLELIKEKLKFDDVTIINDRVEEYAKDHLNEFDLCISRAVAYIDIILELSFPLIKKEGKVILMKGNIDNEIKTINNHKIDLNINEFKIHKYELLNSKNERNLIIVTKKSDSTKVLNYSNIIKRNKKWSN